MLWCAPRRSLGVVFCGSHLSFHRFSKRPRVGCEPPCLSELAALARWLPRSPSCAAARVNPRTRPYPTLRKHRLHHDVSKTRAAKRQKIRPLRFSCRGCRRSGGRRRPRRRGFRHRPSRGHPILHAAVVASSLGPPHRARSSLRCLTRLVRHHLVRRGCMHRRLVFLRKVTISS